MHANIVIALLLASFMTSDLAAAEFNPVRGQRAASIESGSRIIVKFRSSAGSLRAQALSADDSTEAIAKRAGVSMKQSRSLGSQLYVVELETSADSVSTQLAKLQSDAAVEFAEPDRRRHAHSIPNDPLYTGQWYLQNLQPAALNAEGAWDLTTGSTGTVLAVVDTGVRFDHPDLMRAIGGGRLMDGYDFISADPDGSYDSANDGNGWDSDASDPGDWVSNTDRSNSLFSQCEMSDSSWHGTRVSGLVGALTDNSTGIAGESWKTWILPVRVLGKCGGYDSDILAAMRWAAGLHVDGVADNPYPARIVNLSLGSSDECPASYRSVVEELAAAGTLVVASAGNDGGPVGAPANCPGVLAVAGLRHVGTKVGYSSLGAEIAIAAPAGNCVNSSGACLFSIDTTVNFGTTEPGSDGYTDQLNANVGTSFSAPLVAAISALMSGVNGNLQPSQLIARLKTGAAAFPVSSDASIPNCRVPTSWSDIQDSECNCTLLTCGAGMANAPGAVEQALRPIAAIALPGDVSAGRSVTLNASGSAASCGHTIRSYSWTVVSSSENTPGLTGDNTAVATVTAPFSGTHVLRLAVTDDAGRQDSVDVTVSADGVTTDAPVSAGSVACPAAISFAAPTDDDAGDSGAEEATIASKGSSGGGGVMHFSELLLAFLWTLAGKRSVVKRFPGWRIQVWLPLRSALTRRS